METQTLPLLNVLYFLQYTNHSYGKSKMKLLHNVWIKLYNNATRVFPIAFNLFTLNFPLKKDGGEKMAQRF